MAKAYYMTMDCIVKPLHSRTMSGLCRKIFVSEDVKDGKEYTVYDLSHNESFVIKYRADIDKFIKQIPEHVVPATWKPLNYTHGMRKSIDSMKKYVEDEE